MSTSLHGSCVCGQVTYTLSQRPQVTVACHCRQCQKRSAGAYTVSAMVDVDALEVHGRLHEYARRAASGEEATGCFCPDCGTHIVHRTTGMPGKVMVQIQTLDDAPSEPPSVHVWTGEKSAWDAIPEGLTTFATQP